jgi:hypothetical protein
MLASQGFSPKTRKICAANNSVFEQAGAGFSFRF